MKQNQGTFLFISHGRSGTEVAVRGPVRSLWALRGVPRRVPATQILTLLPDNKKKSLLRFSRRAVAPCRAPLCSSSATDQTVKEKKAISQFSHGPRPSFASKNLSFMDVCCRWVKYYIKASLMFHSESHVSCWYRVQNSRRLRFYSRFNGSMSIITLALA